MPLCPTAFKWFNPHRDAVRRPGASVCGLLRPGFPMARLPDTRPKNRRTERLTKVFYL